MGTDLFCPELGLAQSWGWCVPSGAPALARWHWVSHSPAFLPASCDFEQDTCGWSSPSDPRLHGFAWGWKSAITLAKYPGPEQDHTLGTRNGRKHPSLAWPEAGKRSWGWMGSVQSAL